VPQLRVEANTPLVLRAYASDVHALFVLTDGLPSSLLPLGPVPGEGGT
jgi:hypothetical protein